MVLYGLLQSYRRFAAPSIGPGISGLVLIACYLTFVPLNKGRALAQLPLAAELVLSVGTTLASPRWSWWRCGRRGGCACGSGRYCGSRPGWRAGSAGLALVGAAELVAIDVANDRCDLKVGLDWMRRIARLRPTGKRAK